MHLRSLVFGVFAAWLVAGCDAPLHKSLNEPGAAFDQRLNLTSGKYTVFYYYADWCPSCKKWAPTMHAVASRFDDMSVRFINIDSFDSPVARQHSINFVPNFKIYDPKGNLIAEDKVADAWLRAQIQQRTGSLR